MVIVYSTPNCNACKKVKEYLNSKKITFENIDLTKISPEEQMKLSSKLGRMSVPIISVNEKIMYSLSELKEIYG